MDNLHSINKDNILPEEEYCHYSGLPSVQFYENIEKENMQEKESKTNWHFGISVVKSGIRIMAGITLINDQVLIAGILLILAEIFGIVEEF
jgi:hypothetical protein